MHDTINAQQRIALARIHRLLIEAGDAAYTVGIDSVGNEVTRTLRFVETTQAKLHERIRRDASDAMSILDPRD